MSDSQATHDQRSSSIRESARDSTSEPSDAASDSTDDRRVLERTVPPLATPIRKASFWGAIVLPFFYVPLLVTGISTAFESLAFLGLLAINLLAFYVGHAHRR